jgi:uncharacterized protein YgiM (DUF1202 family)
LSNGPAEEKKVVEFAKRTWAIGWIGLSLFCNVEASAQQVMPVQPEQIEAAKSHVRPAPEHPRRTIVTLGATDAVNVRAGPSTNSMVIGQLKRGDTVTQRRDPGSSEWVEVLRQNGEIGFVARRYLEVHNIEEFEDDRRLPQAFPQNALLPRSAPKQTFKVVSRPRASLPPKEADLPPELRTDLKMAESSELWVPVQPADRHNLDGNESPFSIVNGADKINLGLLNVFKPTDKYTTENNEIYPRPAILVEMISAKLSELAKKVEDEWSNKYRAAIKEFNAAQQSLLRYRKSIDTIESQVQILNQALTKKKALVDVYYQSISNIPTRKFVVGRRKINSSRERPSIELFGEMSRKMVFEYSSNGGKVDWRPIHLETMSSIVNGEFKEHIRTISAINITQMERGPSIFTRKFDGQLQPDTRNWMEKRGIDAIDAELWAIQQFRVLPAFQDPRISKVTEVRSPGAKPSSVQPIDNNPGVYPLPLQQFVVKPRNPERDCENVLGGRGQADLSMIVPNDWLPPDVIQKPDNDFVKDLVWQSCDVFTANVNSIKELKKETSIHINELNDADQEIGGLKSDIMGTFEKNIEKELSVVGATREDINLIREFLLDLLRVEIHLSPRKSNGVDVSEEIDLMLKKLIIELREKGGQIQKDAELKQRNLEEVVAARPYIFFAPGTKSQEETFLKTHFQDALNKAIVSLRERMKNRTNFDITIVENGFLKSKEAASYLNKSTVTRAWAWSPVVQERRYGVVRSISVLTVIAAIEVVYRHEIPISPVSLADKGVSEREPIKVAVAPLAGQTPAKASNGSAERGTGSRSDEKREAVSNGMSARQQHISGHSRFEAGAPLRNWVVLRPGDGNGGNTCGFRYLDIPERELLPTGFVLPTESACGALSDAMRSMPGSDTDHQSSLRWMFADDSEPVRVWLQESAESFLGRASACNVRNGTVIQLPKDACGHVFGIEQQ